MEKQEVKELWDLLENKMPFLKEFSIGNKVNYNLFIAHFWITFDDFYQFIRYDDFAKEAGKLVNEKHDTIAIPYFLRWVYSFDISILEGRHKEEFKLFLKYANCLLYNSYPIYAKIEEMKEEYRSIYDRQRIKMGDLQERIISNFSLAGKFEFSESLKKDMLTFANRIEMAVTNLIQKAFDISNQDEIRCSTNILHYALNEHPLTKLEYPIDKEDIRIFMKSKGHNAAFLSGVIRFPIRVKADGAGITFLDINGKTPTGSYYLLKKKDWY